MSVRTAIDLLENYPEDLQVVVSGYGQSYDDLSPEQISVIPIALNNGVHELGDSTGIRMVIAQPFKRLRQLLKYWHFVKHQTDIILL